MKKFFLFALVATMFAACVTSETQDVAVELSSDTLTVSFEDSDSRIQLNEVGKTVWTKGDLASVFYRSNANQKWQYQGETGERTGNLKRVNAGNATETMSRVVVVYPYSDNYYINTDTYNVEASLPASQNYLKDSYGEGGNIMISQSEFNQFSLKSVCGWLKVQLTGNGEKVKSIKLKGNNGEQVAGLLYINSATAEATLAAEMGGADDNENSAGGNLVFDDTILTEVTLNCGEGVALGSEPTSFFIALPPQTFTKGLTIEITSAEGLAMIKSTENEVIIERNHILPMATVEFVGSAVTPPTEDISKIATIEEQVVNIIATITTLESVKDAIEVTISSLQDPQPVTRGNNDNNGVKGMIAALEERIAALEQVISALYDYTERDLAAAEDWEAATLATMEQYKALATELATLKAIVENLDVVSIKTLVDALTASEESMKGWVNEQFAGYCTIAEVDAQIAAIIASLTDDNEAMRKEIDEMVASFTALKNEIESTYKEAISSAINNFAGVVNEQISSTIASVNARIDKEMASINSRLDDIEDRLSELENAVTDLINRIQTISYLGDGDAEVVTSAEGSSLTLSFQISPRDAVESLSSIWQEAVHISARYKNTTPPVFVDMPVKSFQSDATNGIITITSSGENLNAEFFIGTKNVAVALEISDGNNYKISDYIDVDPRRWSADKITGTPTDNEIWYLTSDYNPVSLASTSGFGAQFESHTFNIGLGFYVIRCKDSIKSIEADLFANATNLIGVALPNTITSIEDSAFYNCSNMTTVTLGNSVASIGASAFCKCISLTSITIPDSVTSIGNYAFDSCTSLTRVDISDLSAWCKIGFGSSSANPLNNGAKLYLNGSELTDITIPSDITEIKDYAFYKYTSLTSVTIGNSVTSIGGCAFEDCTSLTSITIPDSVTSIGGYAFYNCTSLTSVTIPNSVTSIGGNAFGNCVGELIIDSNALGLYGGKFTKLTIGNSATSIGWRAFDGCTSLTSVTIGNSVTSIGGYAFRNCTSLTSITIPDSVTSIKEFAFSGCTSLTSITIPDSVTSIGDSAFYNCTNMATVTLGNSVASIGAAAFYRCGNLTSITIPDCVTSIGDDAFYWCDSLTRVDISDLTAWYKIDFGNYMSNPLCYARRLYKSDTEITTLSIPSSITEIKKYTFYNCSSIKKLNNSNYLTSIGDYAFYGCESLTLANIGRNVTEVGMWSFGGCKNLISIYCNATTPPSIWGYYNDEDETGSLSFPFNSNLVIYVPASLYDTYMQYKDVYVDRSSASPEHWGFYTSMIQIKN